MDLGFGDHNQQVGDATANLMLRTAKVQEKAIEDEMAAYDALLEDDDALEMLRAKRLAQMKQEQTNRQQWKSLGHGTYSELVASQNVSTDVAKAFFETTKQSNRVVVHFYRTTSSRLCDIFHAHLTKLAPKHLETRFVKINVEGCDQGNGGAASFLVEKLGIIVMPTLLIVKDRKVVHHIRGFDELGGTENFSTEALEYALSYHDGLKLPDDFNNGEIPSELIPGGGVNSIRIRGSNGSNKKSTIRNGINSGEYYDEDY